MKYIDKTMRKTLTMYGALHPKSSIDRLYLKRGRGLISIEMSARSEENNSDLYVRGSNEMLLKSVKKDGIVKTENLMKKSNLKINGTKRECMDSLFVKSLKK